MRRHVGASLCVEPAARGCFQGREGRGNAGRGPKIHTWRWPASFGGDLSLHLPSRSHSNSLPFLLCRGLSPIPSKSCHCFPPPPRFLFSLLAASLTSLGRSDSKRGFWLQRYLGPKPALLVSLPSPYQAPCWLLVSTQIISKKDALKSPPPHTGPSTALLPPALLLPPARRLSGHPPRHSSRPTGPSSSFS